MGKGSVLACGETKRFRSSTLISAITQYGTTQETETSGQKKIVGGMISFRPRARKFLSQVSSVYISVSSVKCVYFCLKCQVYISVSSVKCIFLSQVSSVYISVSSVKCVNFCLKCQVS